MRAIRDTGNRLVAALDPNDSVGVIDTYFPDSDFFTEFERFDRHIDKLRRSGNKVEYVSICSPNYLHDAHIRFALRNDADAICEKPLVLNPWNIDGLEEIERESGRRVYNVLQLRFHPTIVALKESIAKEGKRLHDVDVTYIAPRGRWYQRSWKGQVEKSGGIATNIGVHFFDMLVWVFGGMRRSIVHLNRQDCAAGLLDLEDARVRWFLSVDASHLPLVGTEREKRTYRSIIVDGKSVEFSDGFTDLHTETYRQILSGGGHGMGEARTAVEIVHDLRVSTTAPLLGEYHPICRQVAPD